MGARPSSYKTGGGGFLNNVDGEITDYEFTDEQPGDPKKRKGGKKNDEFTPLQFRLTATADGADEPVSTSLYTGINAQDVEISDDGKTITREDGEDIAFPSSKPFGLFLSSLVEKGFDESQLPEDGEPVNFEPIIGQRVRFVQQLDTEATKKLGKRKGKDGKEYNRQNLVVSAVYGATEEAAPAKTNGNGKTPAKTPAKSAKKNEDPDYTEDATETLKAILAANDGEINRSKLGTPALKILLKVKHENKDGVLAVLKSEDFLTTEDGWSFNKKTGVIEAA